MVGFYWNAACRGTLHGFGDRVGIPEVVLMALPERFRVSRRYLLYVVTKCSQLAGNIVRCHAGFDADQALRHVYKSCGDPAARCAQNQMANHPVNADAREPSVQCKVWAARAGYWER